MFHRLWELSRLLPKPDDEATGLGQPLGEHYRRGLALCFDAQGSWAGVRACEPPRVLYRKGNAGQYGSDLTPCSRFSGKVPNTVDRLTRSLRRVSETACTQITDSEDAQPRTAWFAAVLQQLEGAAGRDAIVEAVRAAIDCLALPKNASERAYLFVALLGANHEIDPVCLWPETAATLLARLEADWGKSTAQDGICSICGEGPRFVYGSYGVLACYNLDKPGTIAGGFERQSAPARNLPVCRPCSFALDRTITYVREHLAASCAGQTYFALPSCPDSEGREILQGELRRHPERLRLGKAGDLLVQQERDLAELAGDLAHERGDAPQVAYDLVFYEEDNAAWRIQAEVPQILASRVEEVHTASAAVAADPLLARAQKGELRPARFDGGVLKDLTRDELGKASARLTRAWLTAIFSGGRLEWVPTLHQLTRSVLRAYRKSVLTGHLRVGAAWAFLRFADTLALFPRRSQAMDPWTPVSPYGAFCRDHAEFFTSQEQVAAFLTGCYCSIVSYVQYKERKATPFERRYRGRALDRSALERLYTEGRAKLAQYDSLGLVAANLDPDLAEAFVRCEARSTASRDALTFAFTLGLSLQARIAERDRELASAATSETAQ